MKMKKPYRPAHWLVELVTLANGACGLIACFFLVRYVALCNAREVVPCIHLTLVWVFMLFGGIFDGLDGLIARRLKVSTELGKELDSLCDAVTFGVLPAMIIALLNSFSANIYWMIFSWACAVVYLCGALFRLARFDVESLPAEKHHLTFSGLPSPSAAATVGIIVILYIGLREGNIWFVKILWDIFSMNSVIQFSGYLITALPFLGLALGFLMVSEIEFIHMAAVTKYFASRKIFAKILYSLALISLVVLLREMVFLLLLFSVGYGLVMYFYGLIRA